MKHSLETHMEATCFTAGFLTIIMGLVGTISMLMLPYETGRDIPWWLVLWFVFVTAAGFAIVHYIDNRH